MATGVLVLLVGSAVRLSEYAVDHDKLYRARVRLGIETDTYDATGTVVKTRPVNVSPQEIGEALDSFLGKIEQVPPAHSAVQIQGKRAYKLARQGMAVNLAPRAVEIYSIERKSIREPDVEFDVFCSKGTYIRSLAHELGIKLGTGAHLVGLRRLASGPFTIEQSVSLDQVAEAVTAGALQPLLVPMDSVLEKFDAVYLDAARSRAVRSGQFIPAPQYLTSPIVRAYDEEHQLIALLERVSDNQLKPKKVLE